MQWQRNDTKRKVEGKQNNNNNKMELNREREVGKRNEKRSDTNTRTQRE